MYVIGLIIIDYNMCEDDNVGGRFETLPLF